MKSLITGKLRKLISVNMETYSLSKANKNKNLCPKLTRTVKHNWNVNQTKKNILSEIFKIG